MRETEHKLKQVQQDIRVKEKMKMADQASSLSAVDLWRRLNSRKGAKIKQEIDKQEFIEYWGGLYRSDKEFKTRDFVKH